MRKIKQWLSEARSRKRVHSDDLDRIINRCLKKYGHLFPGYICTRKGSRCVHHFNVSEDVKPISLERVHGNRDHVPYPYVTYILDGLESLVAFIEVKTGEEDNDSDDESATDNP
jgi:hypothetical protein